MVRIHGHRGIKSGIRALHQHSSQPQQKQGIHLGNLKCEGNIILYNEPTITPTPIYVYFYALYYHLIIHVVIWTKSKCLFIADSLLGLCPCFPIQASNFDDHFGCPQYSLSQKITYHTPPLAQRHFCTRPLFYVAKQARFNIHYFK